MTLCDVAVAVSTYNRPKALDLVLDGLFRQSLVPQQILIGDDGSGPETARVISQWFDRGLPVERCWHPDLGFRKTIIMNQAITKVKAKYVIFLDGDCIPFRSFISDHLAFAEPKCILAGARILAFELFTRALEAGFEVCHNRSSWYWLGKKIKGATNQWWPLLRLPDGAWRKFRPRNWKLVRGCNFSLFTEDLLRVGGFDESILGWGREDSELAVRLINSGLQVKSLNWAAPVLHLWHPQENRSGLLENETHLLQSIAEHRTQARIGLERQNNLNH